MKSSPSIWRYVVNVKLTVKNLSIFVAFLENMNFNIVLIFHDQGRRKVWTCKICTFAFQDL